MKPILIAIGLLMLPMSLSAQVQYDWVKKTHGWPYNTTHSSLTLDQAGNSYIVGDFMGTVDFNPGIVVDNHSSSGSTDVFVSKYDSSGNYLWTKTFGGTSDDDLFNIASDDQNNIYCLGRTSGSVNFNPSGSLGQINSSGSYDIFILKLDENGNFVWVKKTGGNLYDFPNGIIYKNGFVYYCGDFESTVDFNPGTGTSNLTAIDRDGFISKLDENGNFVWVKGIQSNLDVACNSISLDEFENLYACGSFRGTADFNPGTGTYISCSKLGGIYLKTQSWREFCLVCANKFQLYRKHSLRRN